MCTRNVNGSVHKRYISGESGKIASMRQQEMQQDFEVINPNYELLLLRAQGLLGKLPKLF